MDNLGCAGCLLHLAAHHIQLFPRLPGRAQLVSAFLACRSSGPWCKFRSGRRPLSLVALLGDIEQWGLALLQCQCDVMSLYHLCHLLQGAQVPAGDHDLLLQVQKPRAARAAL